MSTVYVSGADRGCWALWCLGAVEQAAGDSRGGEATAIEAVGWLQLMSNVQQLRGLQLVMDVLLLQSRQAKDGGTCGEATSGQWIKL